MFTELTFMKPIRADDVPLSAWINDAEMVDWAVPLVMRSCGHTARRCFISGCCREITGVDVLVVRLRTPGIAN